MSAKNAKRKSVSGDERWLSVVGWGDLYEVSNRGRVRTVERFVVGKNGVRQRVPGRIRKTPIFANGYPYVSLCTRVAKRSSVVTVHSLVLAAFVGPRPEGHQARHLDGDRTNSQLENLCYGTASENQLDRRRHGTSNLRGRSWVLTPEKVREIRRKYSNGEESYRTLAEEFGVTVSTICAVVKRKTWRHV